MKFRNNFPPVVTPPHDQQEHHPIVDQPPLKYYKSSKRGLHWKTILLIFILLFIATSVILYFYGIGRRKHSTTTLSEEDTFEDTQFDLFLNEPSTTKQTVTNSPTEEALSPITHTAAHPTPMNVQTPSIASSLSIQLVSSPFESLYFFLKDYAPFLLSTKQHPFLSKLNAPQEGLFDLILFSNTALEQLLQIPSMKHCSQLQHMQQEMVSHWKQLYEWIENEREDFRELQDKLQDSIDTNLKQWFLNTNVPSNRCSRPWLLWMKQLLFVANRITIIRPSWSPDVNLRTKELHFKEQTTGIGSSTQLCSTDKSLHASCSAQQTTIKEFTLTVREATMRTVLEKQLQFSSKDKPYMVLMEENFFVSEDVFLKNHIEEKYLHYFETLQDLIDPVHQLCVNPSRLEPKVSHLLKQIFWNGYTQFSSPLKPTVASVLENVNTTTSWNQGELDEVLGMFCQGKEQGWKQLQSIAKLAATMLQKMNPIHLAILKQEYQFPTVTCSSLNGLFGVCHSFKDLAAVLERDLVTKDSIIRSLNEVKEIVSAQSTSPHTIFISRSSEVPSFVTPFLENQLLTVLHQSIKEGVRVDLKYFPNTTPLFYRDANMHWPTAQQKSNTNQTEQSLLEVDSSTQRVNLVTVHLVKLFAKERGVQMKDLENDKSLIHEFWTWQREKLRSIIPGWKDEVVHEADEDHPNKLDTIIFGEDDEIAFHLEQEGKKKDTIQDEDIQDENLEDFHL